MASTTTARRLPPSPTAVMAEKPRTPHHLPPLKIDAVAEGNDHNEHYITSILGNPRGDLPDDAVHDTILHRAVFSGRGHLSPGTNQPTIEIDTSYNSLYDPHLKTHFGGKSTVRSVLIGSGLVTSDLRVVGSEQDRRQGSRATRLLLEREELTALAQQKETERLARLKLRAHAPVELPPALAESMAKAKERSQRVVDLHAATLRRMEDERRRAQEAEDLRRHEIEVLAAEATRQAQHEQALLVRERRLRQQIQQLSHRPPPTATHTDSPGGRGDALPPIQALKMDVDAASERLALLQATKWQDEARANMEAEAVVERARQDKIAAEHRARLREADERRLREAEERRLRKLQAQVAHDEELGKMAKGSVAVDDTGARHRRAELAEAAAKRHQQKKRDERTALLEAERVKTLENKAAAAARAAAKAKDAREKARSAWAADGAEVLATLGLPADWLARHVAFYARRLSPAHELEPLPITTWRMLLQAPVVGLVVPSHVVDALLATFILATVTVSVSAATLALDLQQYYALPAHVQDEHVWSHLYLPERGGWIFYNQATQRVQTEAPAAINPIASAAVGPVGGVAEGAVMRALVQCMRALPVALFDDDAVPDDLFFLALQSSAMGLNLSARALAFLQDEVPPTESGAINFVETGALVLDLVANYYDEPEPEPRSMWCLMHTPTDGLFVYNKATKALRDCFPAMGPDALNLPDATSFLLDAHVISGFLTVDQDRAGTLPSVTVWDWLESAAGLDMAPEEAVVMMQLLDDGSECMAYRGVVPLCRGLLMAIDTQEEAVGGHEWLFLKDSDQVPFYVNRSTGAVVRHAPGTAPTARHLPLVTATAEPAPEPDISPEDLAQARAATTLQAAWRGTTARRQTVVLRVEKSHQEARRTSERLALEAAEAERLVVEADIRRRAAAAVTLQAALRGTADRRRVSAMRELRRKDRLPKARPPPDLRVLRVAPDTPVAVLVLREAVARPRTVVHVAFALARAEDAQPPRVLPGPVAFFAAVSDDLYGHQTEVKQGRAAAVIQRNFRGHRARVAVKHMRREKTEGAVRLQKHFRGHQARNEAKQLRQHKRDTQAAVVLQKHARRMASKKELLSLRQIRDAATARAQLSARREQAARTIQRFVRGAQGRRVAKQARAAREADTLRKLRRWAAAIVVQAFGRGMLARRRAQALRIARRQARAAVTLQGAERGRVARAWARDERARVKMESAVVAVQARIRGHLARGVLGLLKAAHQRLLAVILIQAGARGFIARAQFRTKQAAYRQKIAVVLIQAHARAYLARQILRDLALQRQQNEAAAVIQRAFRKSVFRAQFVRRLAAKRELRRRDAAARTVQRAHKSSRLRGEINGRVTVRRKHAEAVEAAIVLQKHARGRAARGHCTVMRTERTQAAIQLQAAYRGQVGRRKATAAREWRAAILIQSAFRGWKARTLSRRMDLARARGERELVASYLPGGAPLSCDNCDESDAVVVRCLDCRAFFCEACNTAHTRTKATRGHEAYPIDDIVPRTLFG